MAKDEDTAVELSPAERELYLRLVEVMGTRDVHPDARQRIREAYVPGVTWDTLPADVKALIIQAEQLPRQAWDDPADVPANLEELT